MCIRVEFHHRKNGLFACLARTMKSIALALTSSSMVSIRFLVSGPVSVTAAVGEAVDHAARTVLLLERRILRIVRILRLFFGVQVVQVAEELVEAVVARQHLVAIAEMVLAELARHVALRPSSSAIVGSPS